MDSGKNKKVFTATDNVTTVTTTVSTAQSVASKASSISNSTSKVGAKRKIAGEPEYDVMTAEVKTIIEMSKKFKKNITPKELKKHVSESLEEKEIEALELVDDFLADSVNPMKDRSKEILEQNQEDTKRLKPFIKPVHHELVSLLLCLSLFALSLCLSYCLSIMVFSLAVSLWYRWSMARIWR